MFHKIVKEIVIQDQNVMKYLLNNVFCE
jgi:hypothetical protein